MGEEKPGKQLHSYLPGRFLQTELGPHGEELAEHSFTSRQRKSRSYTFVSFCIKDIFSKDGHNIVRSFCPSFSVSLVFPPPSSGPALPPSSLSVLVAVGGATLGHTNHSCSLEMLVLRTQPRCHEEARPAMTQWPTWTGTQTSSPQTWWSSRSTASTRLPAMWVGPVHSGSSSSLRRED